MGDVGKIYGWTNDIDHGTIDFDSLNSICESIWIQICMQPQINCI